MEMIQEIMGYLKGFADMTSAGKGAAIVLVLMAMWKSSFFRPAWDKLGAWKVVVAPALGVLLAIFQMNWMADSKAVEMLWAGIQSGALAMGFHTLINAIKSVPVVGEGYKKWLDIIDALLFRPKLK